MFQECFPPHFPFGSEIVTCGAHWHCSKQDVDLARVDNHFPTLPNNGSLYDVIVIAGTKPSLDNWFALCS